MSHFCFPLTAYPQGLGHALRPTLGLPLDTVAPAWLIAHYAESPLTASPQGLGHAVIQDLAALQHPSAVAADTLRFLLLQQHELGVGVGAAA